MASYSYDESESWLSDYPEDVNSENSTEFCSEFDIWLRMKSKLMTTETATTKKKKKNQVLLEDYVEVVDDDDLARTKSLTDEDLDELRDYLDLGFGFKYNEISKLYNTLSALELCYSMSEKFINHHKKLLANSPSAPSDSSSTTSSLIANQKISSLGDHLEDVKARLKHWAQVVACTVRLCS